MLNNRALSINVLEFFWCNILSLGQLEDVLRSVYDFNGPVGEYHADITRANPAILGKGLFSSLRILKVPFEYISTSELDFTSGRVITR